MSFQDAVTTVLTKKYADFSGRARRSEYWFFMLGYMVALIAVEILDLILGTYPILTGLLLLAVLVPSLAVAVRRLHDTGRSGWWLLIGFTGIGLIVLFVWDVTEGESGTNAYGPSPKDGAEVNQAPDANWGQ